MSRLEDRYRALIQATGDIVWTNTADGKMQGPQPGWCAYTGQSEEDCQGYGWAAAVHPDDAQLTIDAWVKAVAVRGMFAFEHRVRRADGAYRWFSIRAVPVLGDDGTILEWVGLHRDIDDERLMLRSAQESRERMQAALDGSCAGTFRWNIGTNELEWDENLDRLFGLERGVTIQSLDRFIACVHPDDRQGVIERCMRCASEGADFEMEFRVVFPDGSIRWLEDKGRTYFDAQGRPAYMTGMCMDTTARKQAADRLRRSEEALRSADQRKDEFLATLAHELRNPLAPIRNAVSLLRIGTSEERTAKIHDLLDRQLTHMVKLVDDLLDVSRISRGKIDLESELLSLESVFEHAIETSRPAIEAGLHKLTTELPTRALMIRGDLTRLAQCVSNLLNNAAKYTPTGGTITLSGKGEGGNAVITVTDNGIGMSADILPTVFEMFAQAPDARGRAQGGLGIGLSLVHQLVAMHGGSVEARSAGVGLGSSFTIRVPLAAGSEKAHEAEGNAVAARARRILVVDDNVDGADTFVMLLEYDGHAAAVVHDGETALETIRSFRPDVVFLDIGLPGITGYEVARQIRGDHDLPQPVLVALTGWGSDNDRKLGRDAGFDHHLTKPVDTGAVRALIAQLASNQ